MAITHPPMTRRTFVKALTALPLLSSMLPVKKAAAVQNQQPALQVMNYNQRYNEIRGLVSHNAFANPYNGYPLGFSFDPITFAISETATNQRSSITQQLWYGVRGFDLDVWWDEPNQRIVCSHGRAIDVPLDDILYEITAFLWQPENQNEIVTLFFEDYLGRYFTELPNTLDKTELWFDMSWYDIAANGWPTIGEMIYNDHRLVAFVQNTQPENQGDCRPIPFLYDYAVETVYSAASTNINSWMEKREESAPLSGPALLSGISTANTLAIVNHFKKNPEWTFTDYEGDMNGWSYLKNHIDYFNWNHGRVPNFLKLNFVDVGAGREILDYMANQQAMEDYAWTPFIIDGINWDTEYLVSIPDPYYLVGIDVMDEPGYGITNMMATGTTDYYTQNLEVIPAFGRSNYDPNRGWVNNEFNGNWRSLLCPVGTYIDAVQVAKHHQWGIVNVRCHLWNYGWSDWLTNNEKEDAERLSVFQIVDSIRGFHIKYEGGHGLVDLRYAWRPY